MSLPTFLPTTGRLYAARHRTVPDLVLELKRLPGLVLVELRMPGWFHLALTTEKPLIREPESPTGTYLYHYLLRRGRDGRYLLVSSHFDLVLELLDQLAFRGHLTSPEVNVSALVNDLVESPGAYTMSAVHARVEGYGQALRKTAFYGSDLGEAALFCRILENVSPEWVTLRHAATRADVVSIGFKGAVAFQYGGLQTLRDVDSALKFLSQRAYVQWEAAEDAGETSNDGATRRS